MFTGIIKSISTIKTIQAKKHGLVFEIALPKTWKLNLGDSVAVDGACLTVAKISRSSFVCELMKETLDKTKFSGSVPKKVNLEQAVRATDSLDGHQVLGHVDAIGQIFKITTIVSSRTIKIKFPNKFKNLVAEKGSISVDGISLTLVDAGNDWFTVSLVDYTIKHTTLGEKITGDLVNIEFDIIAKYINRIYETRNTRQI